MGCQVSPALSQSLIDATKSVKRCCEQGLKVALMPTLIRFIIIMLFLGGLAAGAMFALTVFVEPREKEVSQRVPARDLFGN